MNIRDRMRKAQAEKDTQIDPNQPDRSPEDLLEDIYTLMKKIIAKIDEFKAYGGR